MPRTPNEPLRVEEIFEAHHMLAAETAEVFQAPHPAENRIRTLGNYMLLCAIGTPEMDESSYDFVFRGGLLLTGLDVDQATRLYNLARRSDTVRYVYSLAYIPDSEDVPGIVRRPKSVTLSEAPFVRGILARKQIVA